jgi:uncharacterized protein YkwD
MHKTEPARFERKIPAGSVGGLGRGAEENAHETLGGGPQPLYYGAEMTFPRVSLLWTLGAVLLAASVPACGARKGGSGAGGPSTGPHAREAGPIERPEGPMTLDDAREYMLALVNHDRAAEGLSPVDMDETAERAAQRHVGDMTRKGFTGHWGSDGSVPEQRYTESGGAKFVQENAACLFDGQARELDPDPRFSAVDLEELEGAFMAEVPPNDGHRRNILKPLHHLLGVGLAKPKGVDKACLAQEFVDDFGEFDEIPVNAKVGQTLHVSGEVKPPVQFGAVGVGRTDASDELSVEHLLTTSSYRMPSPFILYSPAGFKTPKPVKVDGNRFSIDVPLDDKRRPGLYTVSVWGQFPGERPGKLDMISLRTVRVR